MQSEHFRVRWASPDVRRYRCGTQPFHHLLALSKCRVGGTLVTKATSVPVTFPSNVRGIDCKRCQIVIETNPFRWDGRDRLRQRLLIAVRSRHFCAKLCQIHLRRDRRRPQQRCDQHS